MIRNWLVLPNQPNTSHPITHLVNNITCNTTKRSKIIQNDVLLLRLKICPVLPIYWNIIMNKALTVVSLRVFIPLNFYTLTVPLWVFDIFHFEPD